MPNSLKTVPIIMKVSLQRYEGRKTKDKNIVLLRTFTDLDEVLGEEETKLGNEHIKI